MRRCCIPLLITRKKELCLQASSVGGACPHRASQRVGTGLHITETSSPSTGDVTVTAAIYCNVPTTVSFRLDYRVGATLPETHYECRIGNYFESNSGRGEKEFTVSLPAGKTDVSLSLRNIIVAAEMELFIESVTGDDNGIGYPSSLAIYF